MTMWVATAPVVVPYSAAWRVRYATCALHISFLLGMQLMFGHEPPTHRRSTTAVRRPDRARSQASAFPPCPLPSTSASYRSGVAMVFPPGKREPTGSIAVDRPGSRTHQRKRDDGCDVQEIAFVSGRSELWASVADAQHLDRAETIGQMNREDCYGEQDDAGNAHQRDEGSQQEGHATQKFSGGREPSHHVRCRNTDSVKDRRERFGASVPFRKPMCEKSIANDQSKRDRRVGRTLRPQNPPSPYAPDESRHCIPPSASEPRERAHAAARSAVDDNHLAGGLVRFHGAMRFTDLFEAEYAGGLGLELAGGRLPRNVLQRHV